MRVVLLTQDEPLFLTPAIDYLLGRTPKDVTVVGCVVFAPSPLGKKVGMAGRARELLRVFGPAYFARYAAKFAVARLNPARSLRRVLQRQRVPTITLEGDIN